MVVELWPALDSKRSQKINMDALLAMIGSMQIVFRPFTADGTV